jgi:hypothetical protein
MQVAHYASELELQDGIEIADDGRLGWGQVLHSYILLRM